MAQPISFSVPRRDPREELRARVEEAPAEHAEAVLAAYDVLQKLHDAGVLDVLRGLLGSRDKVLGTVVEAVQSPETVRMIRNALSIGKTLAAFDPEVLDGFVQALPKALDRARAQAADPPSLLSVLGQFRDPDVRRGILAVNSILREWGRDFTSQPARPPDR